MVFPYYPRPEDDTQEPEEEQQQQGSPSYWPFYLSYIYPAPPAPDPGYVAPGESHPLPSGPTTPPEPPIPNDIVAHVPPSPPISGPGYIMPGVTLNPSSESQPTEQTTGQAPSSDSGRQGSTDWSQAEDPSGASQDAEETSAQAMLRDIDDAVENFIIDELAAGLGLERLNGYGSMDVLRVKQDLEARLFTAARIFATSDSFEVGCSFLYAFPEDVGGIEVIRRAWDLCQEPGRASEGSSSDAGNDVEETFTLDDVRQFVEIDTAAIDEG